MTIAPAPWPSGADPAVARAREVPPPRLNRLGRAVLNSGARARAQREVVLPRLERLGGDLHGCGVLEVGCGRGTGAEAVLDRWKGVDIDAVDADPTMVRLARARLAGRARVRLSDMTALDVPSASYGAVVDLGALHMEPLWTTALREVHRVLVPGGRLLFEEIVVPARQALVPLATRGRVPRHFDLPSLLDELEAVGFELLGFERLRRGPVTNVVGDVVGVARRRLDP